MDQIGFAWGDPCAVYVCTHCHVAQPFDSFPSKHGVRQPKCRACRLKYSQEWHKRNKGYSHRYLNQWRAENSDAYDKIVARYAKKQHAKRESRYVFAVAVRKAFRSVSGAINRRNNLRRLAEAKETQRAAVRQTFEPTVYFVRSGDTGPIKIGYTERPIGQRLADLQTGCPTKLSVLKTVAAQKEHEIELHRRFYASRLHGEWFEATHELLAYIESIGN